MIRKTDDCEREDEGKVVFLLRTSKCNVSEMSPSLTILLMKGEQVGFNKEVVASLCNMQRFNENITGNFPDDKTSFFIGFATETDGTYQQGLTSLSPINFELICTQSTNPEDFSSHVSTPPLLCLLTDASISILVQPNGMPPLVRIGNYDLTTPE